MPDNMPLDCICLDCTQTCTTHVQVHTPIFFQHAPDVVLKVTNSSINASQVPEPSKDGTVIPRPRAGNATDVGNWRTICLLNVCNKMIEKICPPPQLQDHLQSENIISQYQYGFIPRLTTGDSIYGLVLELYTARNKSQQSAVVILNMRKAFDTVNHSILLEKLSSLNIDARTDKLKCCLDKRISHNLE